VNLPRLSSAFKGAHARLAAGASAAICAHFLLRQFYGAAGATVLAPLWIALAAGFVYLLPPLIRGIFQGRFNTDLLAGVSIVSSVLLGEYLVGVIIVIMLSGGEALEQYAAARASSSLDALARRMPQVAHRVTPNGTEDVLTETIEPGDAVMVFPHEICPVDGVVMEGHGSMDESYLTGEPYQVQKTVGVTVISGAVNGPAALTVRATRKSSDSRYAQIMRVMQDAELTRPRLRRLADRMGAWYTPLALGLAAASWAVSGDPLRFLSVVVVATPCPLLIAIPVALIGAISLAARRGIIVRNPAIFEHISTCRTLIFDKTGTLTYGRPKLAEIHCAPGFSRDEALLLAASLERYSKHPLAAPVLEAARQSGSPVPAAVSIAEPPGQGITGTIGGKRVALTGRAKLGEAAAALPEPAGGLEFILLVDGAVAAAFHFQDAPRWDSGVFIGHLKPRHGVDRVVLLTGDRESEARRLAAMLGISEVLGSQTPEQKLDFVRQATATGATLFVGDGINDAPAMAAATVGVAFGRDNEILFEAADAVILDPSLRHVDELMHISGRMLRIAWQSAGGGMALSGAGMLAAAFGILPPIGGALAQEAIDIFAVFNALRAAVPPRELTDF
jgi:heavy metal translocating P-type ATPase